MLLPIFTDGQLNGHIFSEVGAKHVDVFECHSI